MNKITLSYLAGFFDGEGSINITTRKRKHFAVEHTLSIAIGQKDGKTLDWIKDEFGGNIHTVKRDGTYFWYTSNQKAYEVLKILYPYLKYKKHQAELALRFYDEREDTRRKPVPLEELERRENIRQELKLSHKTIIKSQYAATTTKRKDTENELLYGGNFVTNDSTKTVFLKLGNIDKDSPFI